MLRFFRPARLAHLPARLFPAGSRAAALPIALALGASLAACSSDKDSIVHVPTYPSLMGPQTSLSDQGGIYQQGTAMALYETPRARHVGDLLFVKLDDSFTTNSKATTDGSRSSDITAKPAAGDPVGAAGTLARWMNIGSSNTNFSGKATITGTGSLQGTLSVSVISVLPSGNLMVAGDKIVSTNNDKQTIRFSGVVNPVDIQPGNTVTSSRVANMRIEQQGQGILTDSTHQGWLQHLFMAGSTY
jgi:flagellar L-ring protein precursor FlgH